MQVNEIEQAGIQVLQTTQPPAQRVTHSSNATQLVPVSPASTEQSTQASELRPFSPTTALQTSTGGLLDRIVSPTAITQTAPTEVRTSSPTVETSGARNEFLVRGADSRLANRAAAVFESRQSQPAPSVEVSSAGSEFAAARATRAIRETDPFAESNGASSSSSSTEGNIRALADRIESQVQARNSSDRATTPATETSNSTNIPTALSTAQQANPEVEIRAFEQTPVIALALISIDTSAVRFLTDPNAVQAATEIDPARLVADNGDASRSEENRNFAQAESRPQTSRSAEVQSHAAAAAFQRSTASSQSFAVNLVV